MSVTTYTEFVRRMISDRHIGEDIFTAINPLLTLKKVSVGAVKAVKVVKTQPSIPLTPST